MQARFPLGQVDATCTTCNTIGVLRSRSPCLSYCQSSRGGDFFDGSKPHKPKAQHKPPRTTSQSPGFEGHATCPSACPTTFAPGEEAG